MTKWRGQGPKPRALQKAVNDHTRVCYPLEIDRIQRLARTLGIDHRILLGRAIAHELGHFILGTASHGTGLMREVWSHIELLVIDPDVTARRCRSSAAFSVGVRVPNVEAFGMPVNLGLECIPVISRPSGGMPGPRLLVALPAFRMSIRRQPIHSVLAGMR